MEEDEETDGLAPLKHNPTPLFSLTVSTIVDFLSTPFISVRSEATKNAKSTEDIKELAQTYRRFIQQLPVRLLKDILEESLSRAYRSQCGRLEENYYPMSLYFAEVLFDSKMDTFTVPCFRHFSREHQSALVDVLSKHGMDLETLSLSSMFLCTLSPVTRLDASNMLTILGCSTRLQELEISRVADDYVLQVIGAHCFTLKHLDVSWSNGVTNTGIAYLVISSNRHENQEGDECTSKSPCGLSLNPLCLTLKGINISGTGATNCSAVFLKKHIGGIMVHWVGLCRQLSVCEEQVMGQPEPYFRLEYSHKGCSPWTDSPHCCSGGKETAVFTWRRSVCHLTGFTNLTSIVVHSSSATPDWMTELYSYVDVRGDTLTEVVLVHPGTVFVGCLVRQCPNLQLLLVQSTLVKWCEGAKPLKLRHDSLQYVTLLEKVTWEAIENMLKATPRMSHLIFGSCIGFSGDIEAISQAAVSKSIETLYTKNSDVFIDVGTIASFLKQQTHMCSIGSMDCFNNEEEKRKYIEKLKLKGERKLTILGSEFFSIIASFYDFK